MTNKEKLDDIFKEVFSVTGTELVGLDKNSVDIWDSVHQLSLTSAIEDKFDIMLDAEDILDLTSYNNAVDILKKYEIEF